MATAADIEVAVEAAGADEARQELEGVSDSIEDTTDEMSESSGQLAGLQRRWSGAFTAMTAGLAVASGFLLSRVPVLGELFAGFGAIVEAVAFQMDQVLRPVFGPIIDFMFDLSDAIFELDGPLGDLVGLVASAGVALVGLQVISSIIGLLSGLAGTVSTVVGLLGGLSTILSVVGGLVSALVGALSAPVLIGGALVAALALIVEEFIGWGNIINGIVSLVSDLLGTLMNITSAVWEFSLNLLGDAVGLLADAWNTLTDIVGAAGGAIWEFSLNLLGNALDTLGNVFDTLVSIAGETVSKTWSAFLFVFGGALETVQDIFGTLQKIVAETWNAVVEIALELLPDPRDPGGVPPGRGPGPGPPPGGPGRYLPGGGGSSRLDPFTEGTPFLANQAQSINVNIDGREVTRATKQYEDRDTSVRGRFGSSG